jgi:transcriptional regulator
MPEKPIIKDSITISMTFRDAKIHKYFIQRCSETKFEKSFQLRRIFEKYFDKIKDDDIATLINGGDDIVTDFKVLRKRGKKHTVRVKLSKPEIVKFFREKFSNSPARAYFFKSVIMLHFYGSKELNDFLNGNNTAVPFVGLRTPDINMGRRAEDKDIKTFTRNLKINDAGQDGLILKPPLTDGKTVDVDAAQNPADKDISGGQEQSPANEEKREWEKPDAMGDFDV